MLLRISRADDCILRWEARNMATCVACHVKWQLPCIVRVVKSMRGSIKSNWDTTDVVQPGKVVILLTGRYAGKKAVIVKNNDDGVSGRPYGHAIVVGLAREPRKVCIAYPHSPSCAIQSLCGSLFQGSKHTVTNSVSRDNLRKGRW